MARFRLLELSYIGERLMEAGEIVDLDPVAMKAGPNLLPLDAPAKGAPKGGAAPEG